jgi:DNA polymerase III alpha subunit
MLAHIEKLLQFHRDAALDHMHDSLFAGMAEASELRLPEAPDAALQWTSAWRGKRSCLGLYVSGHPLDKFKDKLGKRPMNLAQIKEKRLPGHHNGYCGHGVRTCACLLTKNGDQMAFIKLADFSGNVEAVVFPKSFVEYNRAILRPEACIAIKGRVTVSVNRNGEFSRVAKTEALPKPARRLQPGPQGPGFLYTRYEPVL